MSTDSTIGPIFFYDGECGFCNRAIRRLIKRDHGQLFRYAPLQGNHASRLLPKEFTEDLNTMVLLYQGKTYLRSKALVQILTLLGSYPLTTFSLKFIPSFLSDAVYRVIARFRHRLGKTPKACELLDQELQQKLFLD